MSNQQGQLGGWRPRVNAWLQFIDQYRRLYGIDLQTAAANNAATFPKNTLVTVIGPFVRSLAIWIVKSALRDAATELGITIDDATLSLLADLVVTAALTTA